MSDSVYGRSGVPRSSCQAAAARTVAGVIRNVGPKAEARIRPYFIRASVPYPPSRLALIVLKDEMELELWADKDGQWTYIRTYDVLAASGDRGPKRKVGDRQVPEGIYQVVSLNPNSRYHLSMKINYPNNYDLEKARDDRRTRLGGDIFIHGKAKSIGCIAVGDRAIEELFVLAAKAGADNIEVVIAPNDFRRSGPDAAAISGPPWVTELYETISHELSHFRDKERTTQPSAS